MGGPPGSNAGFLGRENHDQIDPPAKKTNRQTKKSWANSVEEDLERFNILFLCFLINFEAYYFNYPYNVVSVFVLDVYYAK